MFLVEVVRVGWRVVVAGPVAVFTALAETLSGRAYPALVVGFVAVVLVAAAGVSQRKRCLGGGWGW